jgi:hypothetical protein
MEHASQVVLTINILNLIEDMKKTAKINQNQDLMFQFIIAQKLILYVKSTIPLLWMEAVANAASPGPL